MTHISLIARATIGALAARDDANDADDRAMGLLPTLRRHGPRCAVPENLNRTPLRSKRRRACLGQWHGLRSEFEVRREPEQLAGAVPRCSTLVAVLQSVPNRLPPADAFVGGAWGLLVSWQAAGFRANEHDQRLHTHNHGRVGVDQHRCDQSFAVRTPSHCWHRGSVGIFALRLARHTLRAKICLASCDQSVRVELSSVRVDPKQSLIKPNKVSVDVHGCPSSHARRDPRLIGLGIGEGPTKVGHGKRASEESRREDAQRQHLQHAQDAASRDMRSALGRRFPHLLKCTAELSEDGVISIGGEG